MASDRQILNMYNKENCKFILKILEYGLHKLQERKIGRISSTEENKTGAREGCCKTCIQGTPKPNDSHHIVGQCMLFGNSVIISTPFHKTRT